MKEAARQQVSVVARKRLDRSSNGDSKRTLNPEYQREESKLDRKKVLEAHHLHSSFSLAAVPLPEPQPHIRKDIQVSADNTLANTLTPPSPRLPLQAYSPHSAHRYHQTNNSSVPYLPGSTYQPEKPKPVRPQRHMKSSIPYLCDDGYEPRYQPRNPEYKSFPIWLRDGPSEGNAGAPRLSKAKNKSLSSQVFNLPPESEPEVRRQSHMSSVIYGESNVEQSLCPTRKPKPRQVTDQFSHSFAIANS